MNESTLPKEEGRIRLVVLEFSIKIETLLSSMLRCFLDINEPSKSFGNSNTSLSFNQKANLLLDTKYLDPEDAKKFLTFMEIRNQFIHNEDAKNFTLCLSFIKGKKAWLLKQYPLIQDENEETRIEECWHCLVEDVIKSISKMLGIYTENQKLIIDLRRLK